MRDIETCRTIEDVRTHIDHIDREIVMLLAERGAYVKQAAQFKKTTSDVKAPQRVEQVISKVVALSLELGANPSITEQIYRAMIAGFIQAELAEYATLHSNAQPWQHDPAGGTNMVSVSRKSSEVDEYISKQPPETQRRLEQLRSCIWLAAPHLTELMNYGIPAFALVEGGKRDQQIMIAGYAKHVGFYPHPDVIAEFSEQLAEYKSAKGSIQFPLDKTIPEDLVIRMVKCRMTQLKL